MVSSLSLQQFFECDLVQLRDVQRALPGRKSGKQFVDDLWLRSVSRKSPSRVAATNATAGVSFSQPLQQILYTGKLSVRRLPESLPR